MDNTLNIKKANIGKRVDQPSHKPIQRSKSTKD